MPAEATSPRRSKSRDRDISTERAQRWPPERLSIRKVREVLRLKHALGMSFRKISKATRVGKTQATEYAELAHRASSLPFADPSKGQSLPEYDSGAGNAAVPVRDFAPAPTLDPDFGKVVALKRWLRSIPANGSDRLRAFNISHAREAIRLPLRYAPIILFMPSTSKMRIGGRVNSPCLCWTKIGSSHEHHRVHRSYSQ